MLPEKTAVSYISPIYKTIDEPASGLAGTETLSATKYYEITESASTMQIWKEGWYVISGEDVRYTAGLTIIGDVKVILKDGAKLTVSGAYNAIFVNGDDHLTLYGQEDNTGKLVASGDGKGIAGYSNTSKTLFVVNGGTIDVSGSYAGIACMMNIVINGGSLSATNTKYAIVDAENILVNAGNVTADGERGISTYKMVVNGGVVTATGNGADGIFGYFFNFNGGRVIATGTGDDAVGIGIIVGNDLRDEYMEVTPYFAVNAGDSEVSAERIDNPGSFDVTAFNSKAYKYVEIEPMPVLDDIIPDSGYYADSITGPEKSGIIALTSFFSNLARDYADYTFGDGDRFGIVVYKTEDGIKGSSFESTSTDFAGLKNSKGCFYSFVNDIEEANFNKSVYAIPYAIIDGITTWGTIINTTVNADKWLGSKTTNSPIEEK